MANPEYYDVPDSLIEWWRKQNRIERDAFRLRNGRTPHSLGELRLWAATQIDISAEPASRESSVGN